MKRELLNRGRDKNLWKTYFSPVKWHLQGDIPQDILSMLVPHPRKNNKVDCLT
jgi:hypothetical protein